MEHERGSKKKESRKITPKLLHAKIGVSKETKMRDKQEYHERSGTGKKPKMGETTEDI